MKKIKIIRKEKEPNPEKQVIDALTGQINILKQKLQTLQR